MISAKQLPEVQKQVVKFTLIGVSAVMVDLVVYYLLLNVLPDPNSQLLTLESIAKTFSFISGTLVTYNLNKYWTWRQSDRSNSRFAKFMVLYAVSLGVNVSVNELVLIMLANIEALAWVPREYFVAFVAATGASAVLNFLGQKHWVFAVKE